MTTIQKFEAETRERLIKHIDYRTEEVARRDNLDLQKSGDLVLAYSKVFKEDPGLYDLYRRVRSVSVGKISLID